MKYEKLIVSPDISILSALKRMDEIEMKLLLVSDGNIYKGLISIGDLQRALINTSDFSVQIKNIMRDEYIIASPSDSIDEVKSLMLKIRADFIPVVDSDQNIVRIYFWNDLFGTYMKKVQGDFNLPVVIMAGGIGSRLQPLTNIIPKPLLPISNRSIIEDIINSFASFGCLNFFISVNYKADLVKYYLQSLNLELNLNFVYETKPLGTAGSLSLLKQQITETFFVSNCDILINQDFSEVLHYHRTNGNELTIISAVKDFQIAYGIIESGENGILQSISEKPQYTYMINSGVYILEPHLLDEVPTDVFYNITDLIEAVVLRKGRIGVFPVSEKSWLDIGTWDEYLNVIRNSRS